MDGKLDRILRRLSPEEATGVRKGHLAVSAKVLDALADGLKGSGFKAFRGDCGELAASGTLAVLWLLGTRSPDMMLVDFVGGIHDNRISILLNSNNSIALQVYDGSGEKILLQSKVYEPATYLTILAIWDRRNLSLWINAEKQGSIVMKKEFEYIGPLYLVGIDIEGHLSADSWRWSESGRVGLNFQKANIWHGSLLDALAIAGKAWSERDIVSFTENPWQIGVPGTPCAPFKPAESCA